MPSRIRGSIRLSGSRAGGWRRGRPRLDARILQYLDHVYVDRLAPLQFVGMETPNAAITLTDGAEAKIKELLASQEDASDQTLRVGVRGGGCSGFQYALAFDKRRDDDHVFEQNGVSVVVDKVGMQFVLGSEVDYVDGLQGAGFAVNNPNVVAACGCGSSFQVREDADQQATTV